MMKLGTETGSVVNHLYSRMTKGEPTPEVGMGATILGWTDRHAATIVEVAGDRIVIQQDRAKRTDNRGMSEMQEYEYSRNPDGARSTFKKSKAGVWQEVHFNGETRRWSKRGGSGLRIGERREYHDFSF